MKRVEIKSRWTGAVLYATDVEDGDLHPTRTALARAYLARAYLARADLTGAKLADARLTGASLAGADLTGANLDDASLDPIRDDFRMRLDRVPHEVAGLLAKLEAGQVDGTCYEGECCCFVGTVAKLQHVKWNAVPGLLPETSSATERWFTGIGQGAMPDTNPIAAITADWIRLWQAERGEGEWITGGES